MKRNQSKKSKKSSSRKPKNNGDPQTIQTQEVESNSNESPDPIRKCSHCETPASEERKLRFCSKCHASMYCSRECQVEDWKKHKKVCGVPAAQSTQVTQTTPPSAAERLRELIRMYPPLLPKHPSGISWADLDLKLEQWVKYFGTVLMCSTVHALKLPLYFPRARTHLLYLELQYNPENHDNVGRFFNLDKVDIRLAEAVARTDSIARLNVERLRTMSEENERDGKGLVSGVALLCKPLRVQMVPIGSITPTGMKRTKWVETWEENLRRCLETGDPKFDSDDS